MVAHHVLLQSPRLFGDGDRPVLLERSDARFVVNGIYQQVLERSADPASAGLSQRLASGQATVRDIVREVAV